jgi:dCTP deaminase
MTILYVFLLSIGAMPYLSGEEILNLLRVGMLKVEPFERSSIKPLHMELRLGNKFTTMVSAGTAFIDPTNPKFSISDENILINQQKYLTMHVEDGSSYTANPGEFVLAVTKERITLPQNYVGMLNSRTSLGRLGLQVFCSGGIVDPGFSGQIILEILNVNRVPIILKPGMPVAKLSLEKMGKGQPVQMQPLSAFGAEIK